MNDAQARRAVARGIELLDRRPKGVLMKNAGGACRRAESPEEELALLGQGFRYWPPVGLTQRHGAANPTRKETR